MWKFINAVDLDIKCINNYIVPERNFHCTK